MLTNSLICLTFAARSVFLKLSRNNVALTQKPIVTPKVLPDNCLIITRLHFKMSLDCLLRTLLISLQSYLQCYVSHEFPVESFVSRTVYFAWWVNNSQSIMKLIFNQHF